MAILGQIRSKSIFLIIVIGLALFAFVISGVFDGKGYQAQQPVGVINGEEVLIEDFRGQVDFLERNYNQQGMIAVNNVWNQRLRSEILRQQFEISGIQSGKDHLQNILKNNSTFNSDPQFLNEAGMFDIDKFKTLIIELKTTNPEAYEQWKSQEKIFESQSNEQIYLNLVNAGVNYTQADGKFEYTLQNDNVDIEYIQIPYSSVEDSLISYSESDLKKYINNEDTYFIDDNIIGAIITPDKDIIPDAENLDPAYIVFENYEKVLQWNRSLRFGLAVCTLKRKFKNALYEYFIYSY